MLHNGSSGRSIIYFLVMDAIFFCVFCYDVSSLLKRICKVVQALIMEICPFGLDNNIVFARAWVRFQLWKPKFEMTITLCTLLEF